MDKSIVKSSSTLSLYQELGYRDNCNSGRGKLLQTSKRYFFCNSFPQVMAKLNYLTESMPSLYRHIMSKVQQMFHDIFVSDNHREKNLNGVRINEHHTKLHKANPGVAADPADVIALYHSKSREISQPPAVVGGVDVRNAGARTGLFGGRANSPFDMVQKLTNFSLGLPG